MAEYRPTEHDGLRRDGQPDQRVGTGVFAYGKVDPHDAGKTIHKDDPKGVKKTETEVSESSAPTTQGAENEDVYKPTEHDGRRKDGEHDKRVGTGEFAFGKVDPHNAGDKGNHAKHVHEEAATAATMHFFGSDYKPTEHDSLRKDGKPDGRVKNN